MDQCPKELKKQSGPSCLKEPSLSPACFFTLLHAFAFTCPWEQPGFMTLSLPNSQPWSKGEEDLYSRFFLSDLLWTAIPLCVLVIRHRDLLLIMLSLGMFPTSSCNLTHLYQPVFGTWLITSLPYSASRCFHLQHASDSSQVPLSFQKSCLSSPTQIAHFKTNQKVPWQRNIFIPDRKIIPQQGT